MKRKLIKQGCSGSTIYLPKKWVDRLSLKPGDEISVLEEGNELILTPGSIKKDSHITLETTDMSDKALIIALTSAYWHGCNSIELKSKKKYSFTEINKLVESFIGLVILEQEDHKILIKDVLSEKSEDVEKIIIKIFMTLKVLITKVLEKSKELDELRNSVFRLCNYAQRLIFSNHYGKEKTYAHNILIFSLKKISTPLLHLKRLTKAEKDLLKKLHNWFEQLRVCYSKKDLKLATKLFEEIQKERYSLLDAKNQHLQLGIVLEHLFSLSTRIISVLI